MTSSIYNISRNLYKIRFSSLSEAEVLEETYKKSRKASIESATSTGLQERLFYDALSDAQETEFMFFKEKEEIEIEKNYTIFGRLLTNIGSCFIEKKVPKKPELQYQLDRLWMIINNTRTDEQIQQYDTADSISELITKYNRDITKNEALRLYKFYNKNFQKLLPPLISNYADEKDRKAAEQKFGEIKRFPILWSPVEEVAKNQAKIQLDKDINAGIIISIGTLAFTAVVANYAMKYFAKKS